MLARGHYVARSLGPRVPNFIPNPRQAKRAGFSCRGSVAASPAPENLKMVPNFSTPSIQGSGSKISLSPPQPGCILLLAATDDRAQPLKIAHRDFEKVAVIFRSYLAGGGDSLGSGTL